MRTTRRCLSFRFFALHIFRSALDFAQLDHFLTRCLSTCVALCFTSTLFVGVSPRAETCQTHTFTLISIDSQKTNWIDESKCRQRIRAKSYARIFISDLCFVLSQSGILGVKELTMEWMRNNIKNNEDIFCRFVIVFFSVRFFLLLFLPVY